MRLIDADALKDKALYLDLGLAVVEAVVVSDIDNATTIDPVKHGHWKMYGTAYQCSVCKEGDAFGLTPYCRWCGSKMCEEVGKDAN